MLLCWASSIILVDISICCFVITIVPHPQLFPQFESCQASVAFHFVFAVLTQVVVGKDEGNEV